MSLPPLTERPLAAPGLISYRYKGRYGWIMIGALNDADALRSAKRSMSLGEPTLEHLQIWSADAGRYVPVVAL